MNPFKKFCILFVVLSATLLLIVPPILLYANLGVEDAPARTIDNWYKIKETYARNNSGRKLFVLSGSSILFGVDTAFMERELGITAVNFGTHAGFRKYMFDRVNASLNSGDIVLMPLDYAIYGDNISDETLMYIIGYDPEYFREMSIADKMTCSYQISISMLFRRIIGRIVKHKYGEDPASVYSSVHLNANGDLTSNTYDTSSYKKPRSEVKQVLPYDDIPSNKMMQILSDFAKYCRASNIKLYATWPPMYSITGKKEFYGHDLEIVNGIINLWEANNVPVLGDYRDALMDADDCYNMPSHLNDRGKAKYTRHLIELIRPYI